MDNKIKALADFLGKSVENLRDNGDNYFQVVDGYEYLVLTDGEADEKAQEYIEDSLWAFKAEFILETCGLDSGSNVTHSLREMLGGYARTAMASSVHLLRALAVSTRLLRRQFLRMVEVNS